MYFKNPKSSEVTLVIQKAEVNSNLCFFISLTAVPSGSVCTDRFCLSGQPPDYSVIASVIASVGSDSVSGSLTVTRAFSLTKSMALSILKELRIFSLS